MNKSAVIKLKQKQLKQEKRNKVLVLIPDPKIAGGVTNYYKTLRLDTSNNISYFAVNTAVPQGPVVASFRLFGKYSAFLLKLLFKHYDVVVVNPSLDMGRSFHRDLVFLLLARLLRRRTVVFFRGWFEPYEEKIKSSKWKMFLFRISYAKADKHVVLGNIFKRKLIGLGVSANTPFYVETTVADSSFVKELDLDKKIRRFEKEIDFLFLSRIEKEKGIYIAIDAFNAFQQSSDGRKANLIIAGDGPDLQAVKTYVQNRAIKNIKFLGHIDNERKKKALLESHVMLFPSFTEGLPNSILEGMLYGMPIIARAAGGIPEVIEQNVNGFVTESFEASVFTDYIKLLSSDMGLYKRIAETNHTVAMQRFTSEEVKARIVKIYEGAVG